MGRDATTIPGKTVSFSTRHLRVAYRDRLRIYGAMLGLNMEEALDRALAFGLPRLLWEATGGEDAQAETP